MELICRKTLKPAYVNCTLHDSCMIVSAFADDALERFECFFGFNALPESQTSNKNPRKNYATTYHKAPEACIECYLLPTF